MRWLFIVVLAILVACVLSIGWMTGPGNDRMNGASPPQNPLNPSPAQP